MKAVIFDFDGVIVDSHGYINRLFTDIINQELKLGITEEEFALFPGLRFDERVMLIARQKNMKISREEILRVINKGRDIYFSKNKVELFPGALKLLKDLQKKGIHTALGTNGSKKTVMKQLDALGIRQYFDSVVTFDDVDRGKPAPDMFIKASKDMGVSQDECVVVEDAAEGIIAAKTAGMKAVGVTTTTNKDNLKDADMVVDSVSDLNFNSLQNLWLPDFHHRSREWIKSLLEIFIS